MTSLNVAEAKKRFSDLLGRVAYGGETILITRRGKPMAKMVPVSEPVSVGESVVESADERKLGRIPGLLRHRAPAKPVSIEDMQRAIEEEVSAKTRDAEDR